VTGFGSFDNSQNFFFKSAKWLTRETDRLSDNILSQTDETAESCAEEIVKHRFKMQPSAV